MRENTEKTLFDAIDIFLIYFPGFMKLFSSFLALTKFVILTNWNLNYDFWEAFFTFIIILQILFLNLLNLNSLIICFKYLIIGHNQFEYHFNFKNKKIITHLKIKIFKPLKTFKVKKEESMGLRPIYRF